MKIGSAGFKEKTLRFHELKTSMPDITEKMLSIELKKLEADGLVVRQMLKHKPPLIVSYSLSDLGKTLIPALDAISKRGESLGKKKGKGWIYLSKENDCCFINLFLFRNT